MGALSQFAEAVASLQSGPPALTLGKRDFRLIAKTSKRRSERVSGSPEITIEGWKQHAVGETYLGH